MLPNYKLAKLQAYRVQNKSIKTARLRLAGWFQKGQIGTVGAKKNNANQFKQQQPIKTNKL